MKEFSEKVLNALKMKKNKYHPLVHILGKPKIGNGTYIGFYSEINANKSIVKIGMNCDIASFVAINCADSHKLTIGKSDVIERGGIYIGDNVFIGSHSFIGRNTNIGNNCVIAAGTILINGGIIPPYSLVAGNPFSVKEGYYLENLNHKIEII